MRRTALAAACLTLAPLPAGAVETVRVAVVEGADLVEVRGAGLEIRRLGETASYEKVEAERVRILPGAIGLVVDGRPLHKVDVRLRAKGMLSCAGERVRGELEVRRLPRGLLAVNVLPLEEYLAAVLGSEMPRTFPAEALKAQAVAARTYAVRKKIEAVGGLYHLGPTVLHQVYGGAAQESAEARAAAAATAGEVIIWGMEPIEAYFHSSCGGHTEGGMEALGRALPYLTSVECACQTAQPSPWSLVLGAREARQAFGGSLRGLRVLERTASGRAWRVELTVGTTDRTMPGSELRRLLGYDRLRSLAFNVTEGDGAVRLTGQGAGHGAGLCQWGARAYAEQGWDYGRILAHYYPGTELKKMY